ncbi:hypothetical protein Hsw_1562 [Hymenobacter swuensis DY53]|uniref:Uncharacterized protein n=1 Tax=Hymenobacter swuensis DY53 TaxID=1227739 RepID=W8EZG4_9BACT|nr:hypothetical protein Hsw_1562 [Hymenobacter swuensis DY53]
MPHLFFTGQNRALAWQKSLLIKTFPAPAGPASIFVSILSGAGEVYGKEHLSQRSVMVGT